MSLKDKELYFIILYCFPLGESCLQAIRSAAIILIFLGKTLTWKALLYSPLVNSGLLSARLTLPPLCLTAQN